MYRYYSRSKPDVEREKSKRPLYRIGPTERCFSLCIRAPTYIYPIIRTSSRVRTWRCLIKWKFTHEFVLSACISTAIIVYTNLLRLLTYKEEANKKRKKKQQLEVSFILIHHLEKVKDYLIDSTRLLMKTQWLTINVKCILSFFFFSFHPLMIFHSGMCNEWIRDLFVSHSLSFSRINWNSPRILIVLYKSLRENVRIQSSR